MALRLQALLLPFAAALALLLLILSVVLPLLHYQTVMRAARLATDDAAAAAVLPELRALAGQHPTDVGVIRRTAALLAAVGQPAEARAVLEAGFQRVPASQLLALDLLPYREAAGDWGGVNELLGRLMLRTDLIEVELRSAVLARDWPAVMQWWRRLLQFDSQRAAATLPLSALAAAAEGLPAAAPLLERSREQLPALQMHQLAASGTIGLAVTDWYQLDGEALRLAPLPFDPATASVTLTVDRSGGRLFQLIDVPRAGRYQLTLSGSADPQQALQLRILQDDRLIGETTINERFWQYQATFEPAAGPALLWLDVQPLDQKAWVTFGAAAVSAEARP
jgi:hypothetical protein